MIAVAVLSLLIVVLATSVLAALLSDGDSRDETRQTADGQDRGGTSSAISATARAAAEWLERNTSKGTRVAAPPSLASQVSAALTGRTVVSYDDAADRRVDLLLAPPGAEQDDTVQRLLRRSTRVAVLPDGLQIRQVVRGASPAEERAVRRKAGRQLVSDTRLRLTPPAWSTLAAGNVDPRLMGLLARMASGHTVDVSGFPRGSAERAARAPALAMEITAIDGTLVGDAGPAVQEMRSLLMDHPGPFRPAKVELVTDPKPEVLLVRFLLPRPSGLVPAAPEPLE